MGDLQAAEWAELSREHGIPLNSAVAAHMASNLYPPVDSSFVPVALEAIEHGNDEDWTNQIELPNGKVLSVGEIISQLHLQAFLNLEEDEQLWFHGAEDAEDMGPGVPNCPGHSMTDDQITREECLAATSG